jgi:hypothetical protein
MNTTITINMNNAALRSPHLQARTELEKASTRHSMMANPSSAAAHGTPIVQRLKNQHGPGPVGAHRTTVTV